MMHRFGLIIAGVLFGFAVARGGATDDRTSSREVQAIEEAIQETIKQAEPSVACILVSRSDAYGKLFKDPPSTDNSGKLGPFDASKREMPLMRPQGPGRPRMGDGRRGEDELKKYDLADAAAVPEAFGSGVVLDAEQRLILTNYHVVQDATKIYVRLPGNRGSYADIHAADPRSDLAVLRLLDGNFSLKAIKFGDGDNVRKGQLVISLANPYAAGFVDGSPSASWGILSNLRRKPHNGGEEASKLYKPLYDYGTLIQSDVKLNLGCSGGALLNRQGEMIGLTTSKAAISGSETAGGYAVPIDKVMKRIIDKLRLGEEVEYGYLGISYQPEAPDSDGVTILESTFGSPANRAGLHERDCIVSINGIPVHNGDELSLTVSTLLAGSEARLAVKGHSQLINVTLAKSYVPGKIIASKRSAGVRGFRVDYTSVLFLKYGVELAGRMPAFGRREIRPGVNVIEVQPGSRSAAQLRANDTITHIKVKGERVAVATPAEFYREAAKIPATEPMELTLWTSEWHRSSTVDVTIP